LTVKPGWNRLFPVLVCTAFLELFRATVPLHAETSVISRISLLPNREYGEALLIGLRAARSSIVCSCYLFKTGEGRHNLPRRIAEELIRASRRGVDVTVILEKSGELSDRLNDDNSATASLLVKGGVRVRFDSPLTTSHDKVVIIDRRYVYLGSHNLTQAALLHNNELSVRIDSPEIAEQALSFLERE